MTWRLDEKEYRVFDRNTLVSSDIEVRFSPIFRIGEESGLSQYQDLIRSQFPGYKKLQMKTVSLVNGGGVEFQDQTKHEFISNGPEKLSLVLDKETLRVSCSNHKTREEIKKSFHYGFDALEQCFGGLVPTRLGVRYVNIIDKHIIESALGDELGWNDLVSEAYLRHPHEIDDEKGTNFSTEIRSKTISSGQIALKYGLTQGNEEVPDHFRFDIDRFVGEEDGLAGNADQLTDMIELFITDIYNLFATVRGKRLEEWMGIKE